jgi:hypothetical protein
LCACAKMSKIPFTIYILYDDRVHNITFAICTLPRSKPAMPADRPIFVDSLDPPIWCRGPRDEKMSSRYLGRMDAEAPEI